MTENDLKNNLKKGLVNYLKNYISDNELKTWIMTLDFKIKKEEDKIEVIVLALNIFSLDMIRDKYIEDIRKYIFVHFKEYDKENVIIKFAVNSNPPKIKKSTVNAEKVLKNTIKKPRDFTHLNANYTFEKLVKGKSNEFAYICAQRIAEEPGKEYNPLFIYGASGLGKTHIMQAIGNQIVQTMPEKNVRYMLVQQYTNKWIESLKKGTADDFKKDFQNVDVLLIDDIQFFTAKGSTQEEFFYLFNHLRENQKQIILTSDDVPKNLKDLDDRLKTRFSEGLTVLVNPPEFEMRVAILNKKAEDMRIQLNEESAFYVAQHLFTNVRDLEGALNNIKAYSNLMKKKVVDLDLTKEALRDTICAIVHVQISDIQQAVADFTGTKMTDLIGKSRKSSLVLPRHMAMWLCREITHKSLPEIAASFGGRHHTSVLSAIQTIQKNMENDERLRNNLERLRVSITGSSDR